MALDQTSIVAGPTFARGGRDLLVSWTSTAPAGTVFQVYLDGALSYHGTARQAHFPWPDDDVRAEVGAVGPDEGATDFSGSLPAAPNHRVRLDWDGGSWLGDVAGYRVYGGTAPGGAVDYAAPVATIPATVAGVSFDGWGIGAWGSGRWGSGSGHYTWTSDRLASGTWAFGVASYDAAGNEATPIEVTATVAAPPRPPAADGHGVRLVYTYDATTRVPTLSWRASPG